MFRHSLALVAAALWWCYAMARSGHPLVRGDEVVGFDNLVTGRDENVAHLAGHPGFELRHGDVEEAVGAGRHRRAGRGEGVDRRLMVAGLP